MLVGLLWFLRVLVQWVVIAFFACLAVYFARDWPVLTIFFGIVVFGLVVYGLSNPAFLVRRTVVWGATTVISASLTNLVFPELETATLKALGMSEAVAQFVVDLLGLFRPSVAFWPAIAVLIVLVIYDLCLPIVDKVLAFLSPNLAWLARAEDAGRLTRPDSNQPFEAQHWVSVKNKSKTEVMELVGASLRMIGFFKFPAMLFSGEPLVEASPQRPLLIEPEHTAHIQVSCTGFPNWLNKLIAALKWSRLDVLFEINALIRVYGTEGLESRSLSVSLRTRK